MANPVWRWRMALALLLGGLLPVGCGMRVAAPPAAALLRGWKVAPHQLFDPLAPPGPTRASLNDLSTYWNLDDGVWQSAPGPWQRLGPIGRRPPSAGWSWAAAAMAARASGFTWPAPGAVLYRERVAVTGHPGWAVGPTGITLWAAVRHGQVVAGWLTFHSGRHVFATVYDQGPTVFTLPYWTASAPAPAPAQSAALPAGAFVLADVPAGQAVGGAGGAIPGARAVTFAEGVAAVEGLLIPRGGHAGWRYVALGPAGSALAAQTPQLAWGDATGGGAVGLTLYFASGSASGLAIYALHRSARSSWRAALLFAGGGDVATDVPAPGGSRIVVLGTWDSGHRSLAYQTVVWRNGRFRIGPGIDAPAPPTSTGTSARRRAVKGAPDVSGLSLRLAIHRLASHGLGVLPVVPTSSGARAGTVLWQYPAPGVGLGTWRSLALEVAENTGVLHVGRVPPIAQLRVEDGAGTRVADAKTLASWRPEAAWTLAGALPVMPVVRGPGQLSGGADGWILVARLARPWPMTVPAATGVGRRHAQVDTLAFSDAPLYAGLVLLGSGGQWVAAARLPAARDRALRALVRELAP